MREGGVQDKRRENVELGWVRWREERTEVKGSCNSADAWNEKWANSGEPRYKSSSCSAENHTNPNPSFKGYHSFLSGAVV